MRMLRQIETQRVARLRLDKEWEAWGQTEARGSAIFGEGMAAELDEKLKVEEQQQGNEVSVWMVSLQEDAPRKTQKKMV